MNGTKPPSVAGVYMIINTVNGKRYIGSSVNLYVRYCEHVGDLRENKHSNVHLQRAYNYYGADVFTFEVLEYVDDALQVVVREQYYLDLLAPEYNMCRKAGSCFGIKRSAETRAKIGRYSSMRKLSPEHKKKLIDSRRGKPMSDEHKAKIAAALRGKKKSETHKANLRSAMESSPVYQAARARQREELRGVVPWHAVEASAKATKGMKGKPHSPEHRARIAAALKGRVIPPEVRAKISATKRTRRAKPPSVHLS